MKETNNLVSASAYLLFFIPLLVDGENSEYRFHANQGLILLILSVVVTTLGSLIPIVGWFLILPVGGIFCFVLFIMGLINGFNGNMKELPLVGKFSIIK